jgi:hypothetical protein
LERAGEFQSFDDFLAAVIHTEAEQRSTKAVEREIAKLKKDIYETARKEVQAELSESLVPETKAGLPPKARVLHGQEAIAAGFAEAFSEAQKKGK